MKYFKILSTNNKLLNVATEMGFRSYQKRYSLLIMARKEAAQYLQSEDEKLYHASWMREIFIDDFTDKNRKNHNIVKQSPMLASVDTRRRTRNRV